jgi:hypothetical protein
LFTVGFSFTKGKYVGNFGQFRKPNLGPELFAGIVQRHADVLFLQFAFQPARVIVLRFGHREEPHLLRREPDREGAGEMLDQAADEAFHAAERRAVNHDRAVFLAVGAGVAEVEADRQVVIDLDGAELPFAAQDVLDHEIDLGAVEGRLARFFGEGYAEAGGGIAAGLSALSQLAGSPVYLALSGSRRPTRTR